MADSADRVDDFSDELRQAFDWAQAIELRDGVGTRSVLIGMMRAEPYVSDADQLLRALGVARGALFTALQDAAPLWRIDPEVRLPASPAPPVALTPNVVRALALARTRRPPGRQGEPLAPREVFGALLVLTDSTAYQGLVRVLEGHVAIEQVAAIHREYLHHPEGHTFSELLDARLLGVRSGPLRLQVPRLRTGIRALAFSADGLALAGALTNGELVLWELDSGGVEVLSNMGLDVTALAVSPSGRRVAAALGEGAVAVWASVRQEQVGLGAPDTRLVGLAWSNDGRRLFGAGADGAVYEWRELSADARPERSSNGDAPLLAVACIPSGDLLALDERGTIRLMRRSREELTFSRPDSGPIVTAAFSRDGTRLVLAPAQGPVNVFDVMTGAMRPVETGSPRSSTVLALSADGRRVAIGEGALVRVHDVPDLSDATDTLEEPVVDRVEWLADASARVDLLGREHLAAAIAKRLDRMSRDTPDESFLLHLDGPWGSGKSSILHFLRKQLRAEWLIVDFDAWRQARVGPPWWALLTSLRRALRGQLGRGGGIRLRARETVVRVWRDHGLLAFATLVASAMVGYLVAASGSPLATWVALIAALLTGATLLLGPGRGLAAFLMWDSAMGAKRYEQWHEDPMEGLAKHFAWLVGRSSRPVLFFVDDLDRCDEHHVVDLLDSIQTLVRDAGRRRPGVRGPCFVVAADGRWIRRSYERTHEGFGDAVGAPGRPLGYLFLDKLFQLTVEVPTIGDAQQAAFLRCLLPGSHSAAPPPAGSGAPERIARSDSQREIIAAVHDAIPSERAAAAAAALDRLSEPSLEAEAEHELQKFATVLERNPRSMKRFVNAYSMALSTALLEGRDVDPDCLALWTVVRLRWPELAEQLRKRPEQWDALAAPYDAVLPDPFSELVGSPELSRILEFDGPRLSSETIRALTAT